MSKGFWGFGKKKEKGGASRSNSPEQERTSLMREQSPFGSTTSLCSQQSKGTLYAGQEAKQQTKQLKDLRSEITTKFGKPSGSRSADSIPEEPPAQKETPKK